ncbi:MAG: hypothetical protein KC425_27915 [Anaerolineales bacterium]|nr:hypothetical protein [Anaerolineales bacterium]
MKRPDGLTLLGILLTSLAVLTLEITFTRVFSVLMRYHFAFMVISLALLGSGAAGVWLYLGERRFPAHQTPARLTLLALLFAFGTVLAFWLYLQVPFRFDDISKQGFSWPMAGWLALIYLLLSLPFLLGGAVIALAISRFSQAVGRVYSYDLIGASLGCVVSVLALSTLGAASTVLLIGMLIGVAALLFAWQASRRWRGVSVVSLVLLAALFGSNLSAGWLQVRTRGGYDARQGVLYEKWNALARVTVHEDPGWLQPFGWGLSRSYTGPDPGHLLMLIDATAGTPIQKWDGSWEMIDFLRYDLTSIAYTLLPDAHTFIIGSGGGRDILTGLLFGAQSISAAELNPAIVEAARDVFGEYAGHVYDYPNVHVATEDARTFLTRTAAQYDLIQASLIDTWAASSSGAFSLSENGLYTREAFLTYYDRLTPRGMVSYSRWYQLADPTETLRLVTLGLDSWQRAGVPAPAEHIVVIANLNQDRTPGFGLATMLLKRTPFTTAEIATLQAFSHDMGFVVLYAPGYTAVSNPVQTLVNAPDLAAAIAAYPLNIAPPTDDRPFFFNFIHYADLLSDAFDANPAYRSSAEGTLALLAVLGIATLSALLFIIVPVAIRQGRRRAAGPNGSYLAYFAALGLGFMLIMVPSIQRLTLYLGSPTYALALVLFTILLGSGVGSRTTQAVAVTAVPARLRRVVPALVVVIALHLLLIPPITAATQAWTLPLRAAVVVGLIFPAGFLMGQPFPLGIKWVGAKNETILPWMWAINGAASVMGSSLATVLGLAVGFRLVSLSGMICYTLALALALLAWRGQTQRETAVLPTT